MKRACIVGAVAMATTGACGGAGQTRDAPAVDPEPITQSACFYAREVQNFKALDRSSLLIFAPTRRRAYRLTISPPASELRFADSIAFESRSRQVCGRAGDRLLIGGGTVARYGVVDVQRLTETQVDSLLAGPGKDEGGAALEPKTDTAADIEPLENGGDQ